MPTPDRWREVLAERLQTADPRVRTVGEHVDVLLPAVGALMAETVRELAGVIEAEAENWREGYVDAYELAEKVRGEASRQEALLCAYAVRPASPRR
jgi:hypothetical protein